MGRYTGYFRREIIVGAVFLAAFFVYNVSAQAFNLYSFFSRPDKPSSSLTNSELAKPAELEVSMSAEIEATEVAKLMAEISYTQLSLEGSFQLGTERFSDSILVNSSKELSQVDDKLKAQRELLLFNLERSQSLAKDKSVQAYSSDQIQKAREEVQLNTPKFKAIRILSDQEGTDSLESKLKNNPGVKEIKFNQPKVKQDQQTRLDDLRRYVRSVMIGSAQASGTWWPNYTSIAFFDTDEVGFAPNPIWNSMDTLAVGTRTNQGVDSVYHLAQDGYWVYSIHTGTDGRTYLGRIRPTGTGWSGWKMISDSTTDRYPSLMSFRGAIYVGVRNRDGNIYIRHSDDDWNNWTNFRLVGRQTSHGFGMLGYNNSLCVFHKGFTNPNLYLGCSGNEWSFASNIWREVSGQTNQSVVLASAFGELWQGHIGTTGNQVFLRSTRDPAYWGGWWQLNGGQSPRIFDLSSYNPNGTGEQLCVLISGTDNLVSQTCGRKSGSQVQWHPWQRQGLGSVPVSPTVAGTHNALFQMAPQVGGVIHYRFLSSLPSARGYISWMKWNNKSFGTNEGYEHDVLLFNGANVGRNTYLSKSDNGWPNCIPYAQYLSTNLPNPYLDTRFTDFGVCDSMVDDVTFTLGSKDADLIINNRFYFTYWQTGKGSRDIPVFKLNANKTDERPVGCLSNTIIPTWCMFGNDNKTLLDYDPNISRSWSYPYWFRDMYK